MDATIISTGEELIRGRVVNTNNAFLAARLDGRGFDVRRTCTVGDDPEALRDEIRRAAADSSLILVTGGLGPTADDRTRSAVCQAVGRELVEDPRARRWVETRLGSYGRQADERQLSQAHFPAGATVFPNPCGTAPGFACRLGECWVVAMPGVPDEMRTMFGQSVLPFVMRELVPQVFVASETLHLFPIPEPDVDARIRDLTAAGANPTVGITVADGIVTVSVRARADSQRAADDLRARHVAMLKERFGDVVYGCGSTTLAGALSAELQKAGVALAVAESMTGGLVGHMLVDVPGISRFLLADVVAYSNAAKEQLLGVPRRLIERHGAVSEHVAVAMARGVRRVSGARLGLSTTGIAGPGGGSAAKPIGLVYLGVSLDGEDGVRQLSLRGDRTRIIIRASHYALNLARVALVHGVGSV